MQKIQQDDVHIITRHSDIEIKSIVQILETHVYNDRPSWEKFLRLLLLSLGFGFTVAGIIFFFAYNWASLHKFVKLGLIEGLLITAVVFAITIKSNPLLKNIIITVASVLVGILVALFGQSIRPVLIRMRYFLCGLFLFHYGYGLLIFHHCGCCTFY